MASVPQAAIPPVESLTAPYIFGSLFNWALFGVLAVQVYVYATSFPTDKLWLKGLVSSIFIIEIAQTILNAYDLYKWFASGFGNIPALADVNLSPIDIPIFAAVVSFIVQIFFCYRIFGINRAFWPACAFISLVALTQATAALYGAASACPSLASRLHMLTADTESAYIVQSIRAAELNRRVVIVWLVHTTAADVLIAVIMTFLLLRARQAEHRYSSDVLTKIVRLTVETNSVTAAIAIVTLAVFLGFPVCFEYGTSATSIANALSNTGYFYTPSVVVGKLYSNTLLVSLNNRIYLRAAAARKHVQGGPVAFRPSTSAGAPQHSRTGSSAATDDEVTKVQQMGMPMGMPNIRASVMSNALGLPASGENAV